LKMQERISLLSCGFLHRLFFEELWVFERT
jgi:hypothetical protein